MSYEEVFYKAREEFIEICKKTNLKAISKEKLQIKSFGSAKDFEWGKKTKFLKTYCFVYLFSNDSAEIFYKIGKAGEKSDSRYDQHFKYKEKLQGNGSILARSLIDSGKFKETWGIEKENSREKIMEHTRRTFFYFQNYNDPDDSFFALNLLEAFLHAKFKPIFEGPKSQRKLEIV
ncbi:hypothetical protein FACS1894137_04560 [Spirochaetia bacterium]|nr:hypothetical protein FACS1894137_04560 [Spirochaetia bacterium]